MLIDSEWKNRAILITILEQKDKNQDLDNTKQTLI